MLNVGGGNDTYNSRHLDCRYFICNINIYIGLEEGWWVKKSSNLIHLTPFGHGHGMKGGIDMGDWLLKIQSNLGHCPNREGGWLGQPYNCI